MPDLRYTKIARKMIDTPDGFRDLVVVSAIDHTGDYGPNRQIGEPLYGFAVLDEDAPESIHAGDRISLWDLAYHRADVLDDMRLRLPLTASTRIGRDNLLRYFKEVETLDDFCEVFLHVGKFLS